MARTDPELVAARLELLARDSRCVLVASARSGHDTERLCSEISEAFTRRMERSSSDTTPPPRAVCGNGLLDDADTVSRLTQADGVVLAVHRGGTTREDLESCRRLVDVAGVKLLGALLID